MSNETRRLLLDRGLLLAACACTNQVEPLQGNTKVENVSSYPESIAMQEYLSDGYGEIALVPEGRGVRITKEVRGN